MARARDRRDPSRGDALATTGAALSAVFREEAGRLTASVMRVLGDFDAAEEVVQDALLAAWEQWPVDGVPERPAAWLWTVARRRAVDLLRRDVRYRQKLALAAWPAEPPTEPEVLGLLALIRLHRARALARFDGRGRLVLLRDQDRSRWDRTEIAAAGDLLGRAARLRRPGPYQLQAAIVACHAEAPSWEATDWLQILLLYDALLEHLPSAVIRLHRAIALSHVAGPRDALDEVDRLHDELARYHLFHATRAELLRDLGRPLEARHADVQALRLSGNPAERALLEQRVA